MITKNNALFGCTITHTYIHTYNYVYTFCKNVTYHIKCKFPSLGILYGRLSPQTISQASRVSAARPLSSSVSDYVDFSGIPVCSRRARGALRGELPFSQGFLFPAEAPLLLAPSRKMQPPQPFFQDVPRACASSSAPLGQQSTRCKAAMRHWAGKPLSGDSDPPGDGRRGGKGSASPLSN